MHQRLRNGPACFWWTQGTGSDLRNSDLRKRGAKWGKVRRKKKRTQRLHYQKESEMRTASNSGDELHGDPVCIHKTLSTDSFTSFTEK